MTNRDEIQSVVWYPVVNDLIGGWSVATADKSVAQMDEDEVEVATMMDEATARHIATLHNQESLKIDAKPMSQKTVVFHQGKRYEGDDALERALDGEEPDEWLEAELDPPEEP